MRLHSRVSPVAKIFEGQPVMTGVKTAPEGYRICIPEIAREITSCWISAVPSKMS